MHCSTPLRRSCALEARRATQISHGGCSGTLDDHAGFAAARALALQVALNCLSFTSRIP